MNRYQLFLDTTQERLRDALYEKAIEVTGKPVEDMDLKTRARVEGTIDTAVITFMGMGEAFADSLKFVVEDDEPYAE